MGMIFCRHLHLRLFVVNGVKVKSMKNALFLARCSRRRVSSLSFRLPVVAKKFYSSHKKKNQMKKETQCWENNNNNNSNNCLWSLKQVFFFFSKRLFCYYCCWSVSLRISYVYKSVKMYAKSCWLSAVYLQLQLNNIQSVSKWILLTCK